MQKPLHVVTSSTASLRYLEVVPLPVAVEEGGQGRRRRLVRLKQRQIADLKNTKYNRRQTIAAQRFVQARSARLLT